MKEKLTNALGVTGSVIWHIILMVLALSPLIILDLPFWADLIIIFAVMSLPFIGDIVMLGVYIWAFIVAISGPIDIVVIIFFISAGLYVLFDLLPTLLMLFSRK